MTENIDSFEKKIREAALVVSSIVSEVARAVKPGITTNELDSLAAKLIDKLHAKPYNLNYKPEWAKTPYPAVLCTSVNNEIAHGIPDDYILKNGDIITLDLGIKLNGVCGDCAITMPVGQISEKYERLLLTSRRALYAGIQVIKAGILVTEIGKAIDKYTHKYNYVTTQILSGHGIGEEMHIAPTVPNFYNSGPEYLKRFARPLREGEVICIEPMVTYKDRGGMVAPDGWTILTRDGGFVSMYEHMVLVKKDGFEILTDHFTKI